MHPLDSVTACILSITTAMPLRSASCSSCHTCYTHVTLISTLCASPAKLQAILSTEAACNGLQVANVGALAANSPHLERLHSPDPVLPHPCQRGAGAGGGGSAEEDSRVQAAGQHHLHQRHPAVHSAQCALPLSVIYISTSQIALLSQ